MKVLLISHFFPPHGGGGVMRAVKLCKYLPRFGITPIVLTSSGTRYHTVDDSLSSEIDKSVIIERVVPLQSPRPPAAIKKIAATKSGRQPLTTRIKKLLTFPDPYIGFKAKAEARAAELIETYDIRAILSTAPPATDHLIGYNLSKNFKLPLILDYRDLWYYNPYNRPPTLLHGILSKKLEQKFVNQASAIVAIGEGIADIYRDNYGAGDKVHTLTNGYDEDDFAGVSIQPKEVFTISYIGAAYSIGYPVPLLTAIEDCIERKIIDADKIKIRFVGSIDTNSEAAISAHNIKVDMVGPVKHCAAIKEMLSSSANLLLIPDKPGMQGVLTGKLFEYLRAGTPIIGLVPQKGEAAELIRQFNAGYVIEPNDTKKIADVVSDMYKRFYEGSDSTQNTDTITGLEQYSRENIARRYASIIRSVTGE